MKSPATTASAGDPSGAAAPQAPAFACSHCPTCGYNDFPPSDLCPQCWTDRPQLRELSRDGILYSFSTLRSGDRVRFVGYVDLPEQVRVFGQLAVPSPHRPACGMPVRLSGIQAPGDGPCFIFAVPAGQGEPA